MFDPVSLPLVASFFGPAAGGLLKKVAGNRAESLADNLIDPVESLWKKDDLKEALERAYGACMESILSFLKSQGYDEFDLASFKPSFKALLNDEDVGREVDRAIDGAEDWPGPDAEVFRQAWERVEGLRLPPEFQWSQALQGFRSQVARHKVIPKELHETLASLQLARLREAEVHPLPSEYERLRTSVLWSMARDRRQDPKARHTLFTVARNDPNGSFRIDALRALASGWSQDPELRQFLLDSARSDLSESFRREALQALVKGWSQDPELRQLLFNAAPSDRSEGFRKDALGALAGVWSEDPEARKLLFDAARRDPNTEARREVLRALAWGSSRDPAIRQLLFDAVRSDPHRAVRREVVQGLAWRWGQTPGVRELLFDAARSDPDPTVRGVALGALASGWGRDAEVRQLFFDAARSEPSEHLRRTAVLYSMDAAWGQDPATRQLLFDVARHDQHESVRRAVLQVLVHEMDRPTKRLLSRDFDGIEPFLDPRRPVPPAHLARAAAGLKLSIAEINTKVAEASRVLGWSLLEGLQPEAK